MNNAKTIIANKDIIPKGFVTSVNTHNKRLQDVILDINVVKEFIERTELFNVQSLEYKPFLRFKIAEILNSLCSYSLGSYLLGVLKDRKTGAFLLSCEFTPKDNIIDFNIKISTAISHLIGLPNFDAMTGKYYARFAVLNEDNSDSYLRQAHRRMELHNDGTYVNERIDFVLMQKMIEENMQGGNSLILHLDDWKDLETFYHNPLAKQPINWASPASKNTNYKAVHPIFFEEDQNGRPHMSYIDQFAEPANMLQGLYLYELGESLESEKCTSLHIPIGSMLVIQNHFWLHGRDKFVAHKGLKRELLRQRGHFTN